MRSHQTHPYTACCTLPNGITNPLCHQLHELVLHLLVVGDFCRLALEQRQPRAGIVRQYLHAGFEYRSLVLFLRIRRFKLLPQITADCLRVWDFLHVSNPVH